MSYNKYHFIPNLFLLCIIFIFDSLYGSILDSVSHKNYFNLDQVVDKADAIFLVKKTQPFSVIKNNYCDNSNRFPPHKTVTYNFRILKVIKSADTIRDTIIPVFEAYKDLSFTTHCLYYVKKMTMEPLVGFYRSSISFKKSDTLIIFTNRYLVENSKKDKKHFVFTVIDGFESSKKEPLIYAIIARLKRPPKPVSEILKAEQKIYRDRQKQGK